MFADGTRGAVLLLDTEGLGGLNVDFEYDTRLFALGALLASRAGAFDQVCVSKPDSRDGSFEGIPLAFSRTPFSPTPQKRNFI